MKDLTKPNFDVFNKKSLKYRTVVIIAAAMAPSLPVDILAETVRDAFPKEPVKTIKDDILSVIEAAKLGILTDACKEPL